MDAKHSWVPILPDNDFSLRNLPYGVFSTNSLSPRIGVAIGDNVLDLHALAEEGILSSVPFDASTLLSSTLNAYASLSKDIHRAVRKLLFELLRSDTSLGSDLRDNEERKYRVLVPMHDVKMHLPMDIGDYTDFFVGIHHAKICADIFQGALNRNYTNLPVGYHGRASSIVVSGTPFCRPNGQILSDGKPTFGPSKKLDFEMEFAAFIGQGNPMGEPIHVDDAEDHIFGVVLMNDWSARDVQIWESVPLGPFNGKNFCTSISPWVVTLEALNDFRTESLHPGPVLPYLDQKEKKGVFNIPFKSTLITNSKRYHISHCNTRNTIFSFAQMLAHHTAGGCPMRTGDMIATGTLSGSNPEEFSCLLEGTRNGIKPCEARSDDGATVTRSYLQDGDEVEFRAQADDGSGLGKVGFGTCTGVILPSPSPKTR